LIEGGDRTSIVPLSELLLSLIATVESELQQVVLMDFAPHLEHELLAG